ncbi:helix-turn-helix domain-containing protein [Marinomonas gallaica]|uniref:helix-turn-helix domain-containing protein n=1 Tax=Marinomonas gallaica TaxID=1806667 RepID=UPI003A94EEEB
MLAVPLPFVVSLMLCVLAGSLWLQRRRSPPLACWFLLMCAATTAVVGLRWTLDWAVFRTVQPIFASIIPVAAWWIFAKASSSRKPSWRHAVVPIAVTVGSLTYPLWLPPLDVIITGQYVAYGVMLWCAANDAEHPPENVRLSDWQWAIQSKRVAGVMLLFSALIDGAMTVDFMLTDGKYALWILSLGHGLMLPILALAVMCISVSMADDSAIERTDSSSADVLSEAISLPEGSLAEQQEVMARTESVLCEQMLYLDPNLTLARLARKAGIPARQISTAVNKLTQQNISQWVNQFRIEHAKTLLKQTDDPITQIYMDSGFQTKSNFHREFSRITGMTPSAYRTQSKVND